MKPWLFALLLGTVVLSDRVQIDPNPAPAQPEPACVVVVTSAGPVVLCR